MFALSPEQADFSEAWIDGDAEARWRSAAGHGPGVGAESSGSSLLQVDPGCRLARHRDNVEEAIVVVSGVAEIELGGETHRVPAGGVALIPAETPHEIRSVGDGVLSFVGVYGRPDAVSRYDAPVQPSGSRETSPVA